MKLSVQQKNIKNALRLVERVLTRNTALPILNSIVLKTENGRLKLYATNLEIGVTCHIGAKIQEVGEIAVPGRIVTEFISNLGDDTVILTTKNNSLLINSDRYKTQILGSDTKEYPLIPKIKSDPVCSVPAIILKTALEGVIDAVAVSETRPELAGLFLSFSGKNIILAGTDSFRLAERTVQFAHTGKNPVIIPRNTAAELMRFVGEMQGDVAVRIGDNQISFTGPDSEIISRLIDGNYPDYARVIPEKYISKALIDKQELEKNIRLAGLFSSNISDIKLQCSGDKIIITAKNSGKGEIQTSVPAIIKEDPFEVAVNFTYLLDGLKTINTSKIVMEFTGNGSPLVLRPHDDKKDAVYIIMPLRN